MKLTDTCQDFPNFWGCPGGKCIGNELPEDTVKREIKERVKLDFTPTNLFSVGKFRDRLQYRFFGEFKGKIITTNKVKEWRWATFEEAMRLNLAFDYRIILKKLYAQGYL